MKTFMYQRLGLLLATLFLGVVGINAQNSASEKTLSLTISLKDRYSPGFTVCMPISKESPIDLSWKSGNARQTLLAELKGNKDTVFDAVLTTKVFVNDHEVSGWLQGADLTLEKSYTQGFLASSLANDYRERILLLSEKPCASPPKNEK